MAAAQAASGRVEDAASEPAASAVEALPKVIAKDELKHKAAAARAVKSPASGASAAETKAAPTMSELRNLIDQKIAEVRARQGPAPTLKLVAKGGRSRKHGAVASAASGPLSPQDGLAWQGEHWDYNGPAGPQNWGRLKPEFQSCSTGKRQSPIDIRDGIKVQLEPIQFDYHPTPFQVIDNGHTVQVNVPPGNAITVSGRRYELLQFHFHRPSEERINGRQYEMVVHLVHKDAEGRLAVVAVLMDQGKEHPMVQLVWNSLPLEKGVEQASPVMLDLNLMLPEQRQYYTYMGSLTTPPCSEGVLWMVMKQAATLSPYQASVFGRLYNNNARPIQDASGRLIKEGQ
ncbi:MAG: carbonic anhydrase family protein [Burkholderiales bacterium]|nr:carbonic anhydrase family protein [Burkholderiales bacterium]